jgi:hypothetical protein
MAFPKEIEQLRQADAAAASASATARSALLVAWLVHSATDPDNPLYVAEGAPHWHVRTHDEDDDEGSFATVFDALDYAARELDRIGDFESDGAAALAEAGQFEEAWTAQQRAGTIYNLVQNAQAVHKNATLPTWLRAPLYTEADEALNTERLRIAAQHLVERINGEEGPAGFYIRECSNTECAPTDEDEAGDV